MDRRQFLKATGAVSAAAVASAALPPGLARAASAVPKPYATLDDIEHVVIFMQENRPFDQYFGTMSGVIGYDDPHAIKGVFKQLDTDLVNNPSGYVLPWHTDTKTTSAQSNGAKLHDWPNQHIMWNNGLMDMFLAAQSNQADTMAYYTRADIPYQYALADNFTILDRYHCSVFGPTNPNRIMLMSGTVDAEGTMGGPCIENTQQAGDLKWVSVPELLEAKGVSWYLYQESDNYDDNMLPFFEGFNNDTTSAMYKKGNSFLPSPAGKPLGTGIADRLKADVLGGKLPQVSYIVGPTETSEHPDHGPGRGALFIDQVLEALTSDMDVWAKTLVILNFDENDGSFDHVLPPTSPAGTPGEWLLGSPASAGGLNGPVGLGFRVPCILISPFTKGPLVSSDVFDHTSVIKFLERKFGIHCPNISDWRRKTVGDLTTAINFRAAPTAAFPALPSGAKLAAEAAQQASLPKPVMPTDQKMPTQEKLPLRGRPSGLVAAPISVTAPVKPIVPVVVPPATKSNAAPTRSLAATGLDEALPAVAVAMTAVGLVAARLRNRAEEER